MGKDDYKKTYQVIVEGVGTVLDTDNHGYAVEIFCEYRELSRQGQGHCGGCEITMVDSLGALRRYTPTGPTLGATPGFLKIGTKKP